MRMVITSDTHGRHEEVKVPFGDILIHCGDLSRGGSRSTQEFIDWFSSQKHKHKIFIGGNHDRVMQLDRRSVHIPENLTYLEDSGIEVEGIKFWGSPYTPVFFNWYFMAERGANIRKHWDLIPGDTDVLITHGPPSGILDFSGYRPLGQEESCGCGELLSAIMAIQPRVHCFGHIHHSYGSKKLEHPTGRVTQFINAACCNESYEPKNHPWILDL